MKEISYEAYTNNPDNLKEGGWDIKHISVLAESDKQAKELLASCKWFDCVILKNYAVEVEADENGCYPVSDTVSGKHGWVFETEDFGIKDEVTYVPLETKLEIPVEKSVETTLESRFGFHVYEMDLVKHEFSFKTRSNSLEKARQVAKKIADSYSEDDVIIIDEATDSISDGAREEAWVGGVDGEFSDYGAKIVRGSQLAAEALISFKNKEGRNWVENLREAWSTGMYDRQHKEYEATLQRLRNTAFDFDYDAVQDGVTAEELSKELDEYESQEDDEFNEMGL